MKENKQQNDPKILEDDKALIRFNDLKEKNLIIYEVIRGSHAYGTNIETSDIDKSFIYIETMDNILTGNNSIQLNVTKDYVGYELGRYVELLSKQNPNIIELLYTDEKFIETCHPLFRELFINRRDSFLTNKVAYSFGNYAKSQIDKAQGTNKKFMNPMDGPRKSLLEFAWIPVGQGSAKFTDWLKENSIPQEWVGLSAIDHMRYTYHTFIDNEYNNCAIRSMKRFIKDYYWSNLFGFHKERNTQIKFDYFSREIESIRTIYNSQYNGPIDIDGVQPKMSSIPKNADSSTIVQFNMDGFQKYCDDYKEYHEWLAKRNIDRFVENSTNENNFDRKNMMHCHRLLDMCIEILKGEGVNVYRNNREELLDIRKGKSTYKELVDKANKKSELIFKLKTTTTLPDSCDKKMINDLMLEFRYKFYNII